MSQPLLEVDNVTRTFGGVRALDGVSLVVNEGEILSIIGPNGAGKTTLFNIISGVLRPTSGDVRFQGHSIIRWSAQHIAAAGIARTYQIARPFARLSVLDNVAVGALVHERTLERARASAREVLRMTGLALHADRPAAELTITQRKRLEIARALSLRPKLLLLDEVMAGLTPTEIDAMATFIEQLREQGISAIGGVEHVMRVVMKISHRIVVLDFGKTIADGTPAQIAADPRVGEAYFGTSLEEASAT